MNLENPKKSTKLERGSSSSAPPPPPFPPWTELPEHLTADILQRLPTEEIIDSAQRVCTTWWRVCKNPATWRAIDLDYRRPTALDFGNIFRCGGCEPNELCYNGGCGHDHVCRCEESKFGYLFRRAVDLSQGQLLQLKIGVWDLYYFLTYVADRSSQLRYLTAVVCDDEDYDYSNLIELFRGLEKLPQLEELHLTMKPMLTSNDFEAIGIACPMLKSFSYHNCFYEDTDFTGDVVAIRKTMPNLRHLRLCEHQMRYKGLEAILDDCLHLKSLDLRLCPGLEKAYNREMDSGSERRKDLWLHTDSISFMDWIMQRKDSYDRDFEYVDCLCYDCDDIDGCFFNTSYVWTKE